MRSTIPGGRLGIKTDSQTEAARDRHRLEAANDRPGKTMPCPTMDRKQGSLLVLGHLLGWRREGATGRSNSRAKRPSPLKRILMKTVKLFHSSNLCLKRGSLSLIKRLKSSLRS